MAIKEKFLPMRPNVVERKRLQREFLIVYLSATSTTVAAREVGISNSVIRLWMEKYPDFKKGVNKVRKQKTKISKLKKQVKREKDKIRIEIHNKEKRIRKQRDGLREKIKNNDIFPQGRLVIDRRYGKPMTTRERQRDFLVRFPECEFSIKKTCEAVKMSPATYYKWKNTDEVFAHALEIVLEREKDWYVGRNREIAQLDNMAGFNAVKLYLERIAGWTSKKEIEVKGGIMHGVLSIPAPANEEDWEQRSIAQQANLSEGVAMIEHNPLSVLDVADDVMEGELIPAEKSKETVSELAQELLGSLVDQEYVLECEACCETEIEVRELLGEE